MTTKKNTKPRPRLTAMQIVFYGLCVIVVLSMVITAVIQ